MDDPVFEMFSRFSNQWDVRGLEQATGIPVDTLLVIPEAIGAAVRSPSDRVRENELDVVPLIQAQLASGYSVAAVEGGLRTMGDCAATSCDLAESECVSAFRVIEPVARRRAMSEAPTSARPRQPRRSRSRPTTDRAMLAVYHGQQAHAWTASIFEGWERDLPARDCTTPSAGRRRCVFWTSVGTPE